MAEQDKVEVTEQASSAADAVPPTDPPAVPQPEQPTAEATPEVTNGDAAAPAENAEAAAESAAAPAPTTEKKKKSFSLKNSFSFSLKKDKKKLDNGTETPTVNAESEAVGNPSGDQPVVNGNGNDHREASKPADSDEPKAAENGDGAKQKKPKWWKRITQLWADDHKQPAVEAEHPEVPPSHPEVTA